MSLKKNKNKRKTNLFLWISIIGLIFCLAGFFGFQKTLAQSAGGWAKGIWNNTINYIGGTENMSGDPSIGWLKSNSEILGPCSRNGTYGVKLASGGGDVRNVLGAAWFGIGSQGNSGGTCQPDSPSLGWLSFNAGSPSFCTGDCFPAQWKKAPHGTGFEGKITGWAKINSMGDNGWVRIYGAPVDASGTVIAPDGKSNYAWNSGATDTTKENNQGLGWINLEGLKLSSCPTMGCGTPPSLCRGDKFTSCGSNFCTGGGTCTLGRDSISWTCSNDCGDTLSCGGTGSIPWIDTEHGACGSLNGKSICESGKNPTEAELCASGSSHDSFSRHGITATWTCGQTDDRCGGSHEECSAQNRCGWIETAP